MSKKPPARLLIESIAQPLYNLYSSSLRKWTYQDLDLLVMPRIFHPGWFVTSKMLFDRMERTDMKGKSFLELGCGTGSLACAAASMGSKSYASDVTPAACKNAELNAQRNQLEVGIFQSDIFDQMPEGLKFDLIFVNPPFIPAYPDSEDEFAFCCGEEYEYYISLFSGLKDRLNPKGEMIMALAESCNIERILEVADFEGIKYERVDRCRKWAETNFLYRFFLPSSVKS